MGDAIFLRGTFCTKNRGNRKNGLYKCEKCAIINKPCGGVAQLGERSVRIREVKGSNPSGSTINPHRVVVGIFIFTIRLHKFLKAALHKIYKTGSRQNACCRFCVLTFGE